MHEDKEKNSLYWGNTKESKFPDSKKSGVYSETCLFFPIPISQVLLKSVLLLQASVPAVANWEVLCR